MPNRAAWRHRLQSVNFFSEKPSPLSSRLLALAQQDAREKIKRMRRFLIPLLVALPCSLATAQNTVINTIAGTGMQNLSGDNGPAKSATLNQPAGVAVDSSGNVYIADTGNARIRMVTPSGVITTIAGTLCCGFAGDGGPATSASLYQPTGVAVDSSGNVYIADIVDSVVRKITVSTGIISTIAGKVGEVGFYGDGGPAANASLGSPQGVFVDSAGNVFIADTQDHVIRKITASSGNISTVAGTGGVAGFSGDNGPATSAQLYDPTGVFVDASGNIFIADKGNNRIREVAASNGNIQTIAGNGAQSCNTVGCGDGGPATSAVLYNPTGVAVDSSGNIYIASTPGNKVREISGGTITTLAGDGAALYFGDGGNPVYAGLNHPQGVAVDAFGDVFVADTGNNVIREVTPVTAPAPTIKSGGIVPVFSTSNNVQPGEWISIYGANLGPSQGVTWGFPNGQFTTSLGPAGSATSVTIDGIPAYLWYAGSTQINLQVPNDANTNRSVPVVVTVGGQSATSSVNLVNVAPSFSLLDSTHVAAIIVHSDGTYDVVGPTGNSLGYATVAAKAGDLVYLYGVGFGPTNPSVPAGQTLQLPAGVTAQTTNTVAVSINGQNVLTGFAYLAEAGLYQINLTIPSGLGTGDQPLVATVAGVQTQPGVVISLQ